MLPYDYVDDAIPRIRRMSEKRILGFRNLGYSVELFDSH